MKKSKLQLPKDDGQAIRRTEVFEQREKDINMEDAVVNAIGETFNKTFEVVEKTEEKMQIDYGEFCLFSDAKATRVDLNQKQQEPNVKRILKEVDEEERQRMLKEACITYDEIIRESQVPWVSFRVVNISRNE